MSAGEQYGKRKIVNWAEYNRSLVQRGSVTFWLDEAAISQWYSNVKTRPGRGLAPVFSDMALQTCLTLGLVYGLARRQTQGFVDSLFVLMGLPLRAPNYTIYSKSRGKHLVVETAKRLPEGPLDLVIDSTGLKIYGEGEWKVRLHGTGGKRRTWRKLHLAVNPQTHDIVASVLTLADTADGPVLPVLLNQLPPTTLLGEALADGAYDSRACHDRIRHQGGRGVIPPCSGAQPWEDGHPRTERVRACATQGRRVWKRTSGYHRRSLAETAMYRYKTIIGPTMRGRSLATQRVEAQVGVRVINRCNTLGLPQRA